MGTPNTIRVIVADDHAMIRRGIRRILEKNSNILVIGESSTGMDAIHLVHELQPDILLLDIEMPDMKGYHVASKIRASHAQVAILALSTFDDGHFIKEILQMGVDGYINKSEAREKVREAVHRIFYGRTAGELETF
jgi:DNA-binding NarL/FixJ family response regulator